MNAQNFIVNIFDFLSSALFLLIFIRVLLSWMPSVKNGFTQVIFDITEPILKPFRRLNPKNSPLDFSPICVFVLLFILRKIIEMAI